MAINTDIYLPMTSGGWRHQGSNAVTSVSSSITSHSERALFENTKGKGTLFLIVQDAFPCCHCHEYFKKETQDGKKSIIFKITANNGNYSADHGLGLNASTPRIIYYHLGNSKMISMSSAGDDTPPAGFPDHSGIENF
ncbi:hypothetical protein [Dickeya zeae]|uniref:hypothetical protein n=1 Tax=Dickeya zeae TaxID=204042 RepID=UPI00143FDA60|nr:hypothetical protein [Dickeya zeae]QIZ45784.1 hypothetical protein DWV07_02205 [Dickeya zeae]